MSAHARRITDRLAAANDESVDTHIQREAARGARIFRVQQVAIVDSTTHQQFVVPRDEFKQTATQIIVFPGPNQIVLSPQAKIVPTVSYGYIFRHGKEHDPDPSTHAVRIR